MIDNETGNPCPIVRVGALDSPGKVRRELGRLYRAARRAAGPLPDAQSAGRLAYILQILARSIEVTDLEQRIQALEGTQLEPGSPSRRPVRS